MLKWKPFKFTFLEQTKIYWFELFLAVFRLISIPIFIWGVTNTMFFKAKLDVELKVNKAGFQAHWQAGSQLFLVLQEAHDGCHLYQICKDMLEKSVSTIFPWYIHMLHSHLYLTQVVRGLGKMTKDFMMGISIFSFWCIKYEYLHFDILHHVFPKEFFQSQSLVEGAQNIFSRFLDFFPLFFVHNNI